ncbi:hypothetical protein ACFE04_001855 [Oxalis oulophora]
MGQRRNKNHITCLTDLTSVGTNIASSSSGSKSNLIPIDSMVILSTEKGDLFGSSQFMKNKTTICGNPKDGTESSKDSMEIEVPTPSKDTNTSPPLKSQPWKSLFLTKRAHTPNCDIPFIPPVASNGKRVAKFHSDETKIEAEQ